MGKFEIKSDRTGKFIFNLKASNGEVILTSSPYNTLSSCETGVWSVRRNSQFEDNFKRSRTKDGNYFFKLLGGNLQVIGRSEVYTSKSSMENGILSVKTNATEATLEKIF